MSSQMGRPKNAETIEMEKILLAMGEEGIVIKYHDHGMVRSCADRLGIKLRFRRAKDGLGQVDLKVTRVPIRSSVPDVNMMARIFLRNIPVGGFLICYEEYYDFLLETSGELKGMSITKVHKDDGTVEIHRIS